MLRSNLICFGYSDGVVVGDEGKGLIEGNTIYGEERVLGRCHLQLVGPRKVATFPWASETSLENSIHIRSQPHSPSQNKSLVIRLTQGVSQAERFTPI